MGRNILVYGVSRGLGAAIFTQIPKAEDTVFGVSRSAPAMNLTAHDCQWIQADLSMPEQAKEAVVSTLKDAPLDLLIYNVGIWEQDAFSEDYDFEKVSAAEITNMVTTNITAAIIGIQALLPNLRRSPNAKVILIGSTWGLPNHKGKELVFSASKFALRGIAESLREIVREDQIGVSVLNLGYLATEYGIDVPVETVLSETNSTLIPMRDVLSAIAFIAGTSPATCVKEITMPAMMDDNV